MSFVFPDSASSTFGHFQAVQHPQHLDHYHHHHHHHNHQSQSTESTSIVNPSITTEATVVPNGHQTQQAIVYTPPSTDSASETDYCETNSSTKHICSNKGMMRYQDEASLIDDNEAHDNLDSSQTRLVDDHDPYQSPQEKDSPQFSRRSSYWKPKDDGREELRRLAGQTVMEMKQKIDDLERLRIKEQQSMAAAKIAREAEIDELIFRLSTKYRQDMIQQQEEHATKLREVRKGTGYASELTAGLHRSYGQQVETLILEIADLKRVNEALSRRTADRPETTSPILTSASRVDSQKTARPDVSRYSSFSQRDLQVKFQFIAFATSYDIPSIEVPHPGNSFRALIKNVRSAISNYLAFLRSKDSIHAGSTDSAMLYGLSLNLDSCIKLLFFGKGDPYGEEITEEEWLIRGAHTYDLIACVNAPHLTKPESVNPQSPVMSRVQNQRFVSQEPPRTAVSVDTTAIWGKTPSHISRGRGYSVPGGSVSDVLSEASLSPIREASVLGNDATSQSHAYNTTSELRRINEQLSELARSPMSRDDASSTSDEVDDDKIASEVYMDAYPDGPPFTLEGFASRCREPLLKNSDDAEYEPHESADEEEDGEGVGLGNATTSNHGSQRSRRDRGMQADLTNDESFENHQYEMVGDGIDVPAQNDVDDEDTVLPPKHVYTDAIKHNIPMYVEEFLMGPGTGSTDKDKRRAMAPPSVVSSAREGTFPELEHLTEDQAGLTHQSPFSSRSNSKSESDGPQSQFPRTSPILGGSAIYDHEAQDEEYLLSAKSNDDESSHESSVENIEASPFSDTMEEPRSRSNSYRADTNSTATPRPKNVDRHSYSQYSTITGRTPRSRPSISLENNQGESRERMGEKNAYVSLNDSREFRQKTSSAAAAAFVPLPARATKPIPTPHAQAPQFGVYGFPRPTQPSANSPLVPARQQPLTSKPVSRLKTKEAWIAETIAASAPLSRSSSAVPSDECSETATEADDFSEQANSSVNIGKPRLPFGNEPMSNQSLRRASSNQPPWPQSEFFTSPDHSHPYIPPPPAYVPSSNPFTARHQREPSLTPSQALHVNTMLRAAGIDCTRLSPAEYYEFATSSPSIQQAVMQTWAANSYAKVNPMHWPPPPLPSQQQQQQQQQQVSAMQQQGDLRNVQRTFTFPGSGGGGDLYGHGYHQH